MKKTILCIDDIATNLLTIQSVIEDLADDKYEILTALSAHEGLEILQNTDIDIVLLDVMMPEVDGFDCAKMIKSNSVTKDIPIIFVTANKDDETIERCYNVGGDDYINKPFNHTELLARISFHLKSRDQDRMLTKEKEYIQSILDLQENLIVVTDGKKSLNVNKAFLDFYHVKTIEEFRDNYQSICYSFVEEDGYFHLGLVEVGKTWVDEILRRSKEEDIVVKISFEAKEYIFNVKATIFLEQYIVTFTDITQISQVSLEYKHEASYDALTQIFNRNMFNRLIHIKINKAKEENRSLSFVIFDIDFFKKINDSHGHLIGDAILIEIAKLIKSHIRESDLFARWGGEEFVLVFDVNLAKALEIVENLRKIIEVEKFKISDSVTCSFGVTQFMLNDTLDSLILRADSALYEAKNSGRNCTKSA